MIEHISFSQGLVMLSECYRVLKEKGKIRISTPDRRLLGSYRAVMLTFSPGAQFLYSSV
jgi:predicted SAM-dependent methyltransferase